MKGRHLLGVLRQPSWIGLTILVVVLCITFTELGFWQLRRHDERAARNQVELANLDAPAVPVSDVLTDAPLAVGDEWRAVTMTGAFDAEHQVVVRNRTYEGELGYEVVTPLVPESGPAVLVDRGWVPNGTSATDAPDIPQAPGGVVTVSARVRPSPSGDTEAAGLAAGQVRQLAVPVIADTIPYDILTGGYVQLVAGSPGSDEGPAGPRAVLIPELSAGPHLPYAIQWFLFGLIAIGGWLVLFRAALKEAPGQRTGAVRERRPPAMVERG